VNVFSCLTIETKATEQDYIVVQRIMRYKAAPPFESVDEFAGVTVQMKVTVVSLSSEPFTF